MENQRRLDRNLKLSWGILKKRKKERETWIKKKKNFFSLLRH